MTHPWSKLPRSLAGDPRCTLLSPEGACAYLAARLLADDQGALWCVGDRDASGTLAAVIAPKRAGDPGWARAAVEECVAAGLLEVGNDGAALRVIDWLDETTSAAPVAAESADGTIVGERTIGPARAPGRPRKGSAPMSARERRVRSAFTHREWVEFRDVPAGMSWEQWSEQHPATRTKLLRIANETHERNSANGTKLANETRERNSVEGRAGSETSVSSEPSEQKNRAETEGESDAGERERNSRTKLANETTRCSTVESLAPFDAVETLSRMAAASGGRLALMLHTSTQAAEFGALARTLIARGQTTVDGLVLAAAHAAHDPWVSAQGKLPLHRLMSRDAAKLLDLIAAAATCPACGSAPLAADDHRADDDAVETARRRYRTAPLAPPVPVDRPSPGATV